MKGTRDNPGKFNCYSAAEPDEPMFVLLGRDPMAGALVRLWAAAREAAGEDAAKVAEARACADALTMWAINKKGMSTVGPAWEVLQDAMARAVDEWVITHGSAEECEAALRRTKARPHGLTCNSCGAHTNNPTMKPVEHGAGCRYVPQGAAIPLDTFIQDGMAGFAMRQGAALGAIMAKARDARACPKCGAAIGEWCKVDGSEGKPRIHRERRDDDFLKRFDEYQAGRDREQEWHSYRAAACVRLLDAEGKDVQVWPLAVLSDFPRNIPYCLEWHGQYYRVTAIVPRGVVKGAQHGFQNEIVGREITDADPQRDYEREPSPYRLPSEN